MATFPWRDEVTGEMYDLPYVPQSRDELDRMVSEMRARREAEIPAPTGRFSEDIGPAVAAARRSAPGEMVEGVRKFWNEPGEMARGIAREVSRNIPLTGIVRPTEEEGRLSGPHGAAQGLLEGLLTPGGLANVGAIAGSLAFPPAAPILLPAVGFGDVLAGGGEVAKGIEEESPLRATLGGVQALLGAGGGGIGVIKGAKAIEDVAPYVDETARGMGYTDVPVAVSRMAEEGPPPKPPDEPSPVDINASGESAASLEAMNRLKQMEGQGKSFVVYDQAGRRRPLVGADAVDYTPQRGETFGIEDPTGFVEVRAHKVPGKVSYGQPEGPEIKPKGDVEPGELQIDEGSIGDVDDFLESMGVKRAGGPKVVGPEVSEAVPRGSIEPPPLPPGAAPARSLEPDAIPPVRSNLEEMLDETLGVESPTPPPLPPGAAPLKPPTVEKPPLPAKGPFFTEFLQQKFGDKSTTSRERAIARAEWETARQDRRIVRLAEKAGIPPDKLKATLESSPKEGGPEIGRLSAWRRAVLPDIENFETIHPWLKKVFTKYVDEAETPSMRNIADSHRIKEALNPQDQRMVVDILDGKKIIDESVPPNVRQAAVNYRAMLDQTWSDAVTSGTRKATDMPRQNYFPHKFAEGWDDKLTQNLHLDDNWNLRESSLEKARITKRGDYRKDLDVLDEYFLSAYRRISEVQNFGKRLEVLRSFAKKHVTDKTTAEWLQRNIRRIMGREHPGGFDRFAGHARHIQALTDLGFAAFYQPIQATNIALYAGLGRSMRALQVIVKNSPDEVYDAIRSRALVPDITQELVAGAYGAREGIPSRALQKFMWGIPTIDKWTRVIANTAGKYIVRDALKGSKGAVADIKALGFDVTNVASVLKKADTDPDFALKVGRALSDKALFRSGAMEIPGWTSSTAGKLSTQYTRYMYRHSLFVRDIFTDAAKGNVRPLARLLTAAPLIITGMAEVLYPIREGLREILRQGVEGEGMDMDTIASEALGDENVWDEEILWYHVLRSKRIPWSHPLKRALQNISMWGGIGVFQMALEKILGVSGSPLEAGAKALAGPVPSNVMEASGSLIKDIGTLGEDVEWGAPPLKHTRTWGARQIPLAGYPIARRMREELGE